MKFKAITGTLDQICDKQDELLNTNQYVFIDEPGVWYGLSFEHSPVEGHDDLYTLVWLVLPKKERREPSLAKMNEDALDYGLHVQGKDNGYEIINDRGSYVQVAWSKSKLGIRQKLTKIINKRRDEEYNARRTSEILSLPGDRIKDCFLNEEELTQWIETLSESDKQYYLFKVK